DQQAAVRMPQGALARAGKERHPGDGADRPGELVCFAPAVVDGLDIRIGFAARGWPTVAPKHRAHRLIEPINPMAAPKNAPPASAGAAMPIDQRLLSRRPGASHKLGRQTAVNKPARKADPSRPGGRSMSTTSTPNVSSHTRG